MSIINLASLLISILLACCAFAIFLSVAVSFVEHRSSHRVKQQSKSNVETGTMVLFFLVYYVVVKNHIGTIQLTNGYMSLLLSSMGAIIVLIGTYVNVRGRWELGQNWANQIKVYQDHQLMRSGMFALVRHPLYASLIWIFIAGSIIFSNLVALLLTLLIFLPMMYYRAKQEESLLVVVFPKEYPQYQAKVPLFFPKVAV